MSLLVGCSTKTTTNNSEKLTVNLKGAELGVVTSSPAGINCGNTCVFNFTKNTVVTLTAIPDEDSAFEGWQGNCSGVGPCSVNINGKVDVTATFTSNQLQFTLPANLPDATVDEEYAYNFQATLPVGGKQPYRFQLATGVGFPPFGISVKTDNTIGGTPTTEEKRSFDICIVDSAGHQECSNTNLKVLPKEKTKNLTGHWKGPWEMKSDISAYCPNMPTLTHTGQMTADFIETKEKITGEVTINGLKNINIDGFGKCTTTPGPSFTGTVKGTLKEENLTFSINFGDPDLFMNEIDVEAKFKDGQIIGTIDSLGGKGSATLKRFILPQI